MALTRDKGGYSPKGGGVIKIVEVTDAGVLVTPTTYYDIGYIQESEFKDLTPSDTVKDEAGDTVQTTDGDREVTVNATLMQSDGDVLALAKSVRNKYYALYKYNGVVNGKYQEVFFACGKITPQLDLKKPGGTVPFEYKATSIASAITITAGEMTAGAWGAKTTVACTISADDYYTIVETAIE